jgi:hypothetical protein
MRPTTPILRFFISQPSADFKLARVAVKSIPVHHRHVVHPVFDARNRLPPRCSHRQAEDYYHVEGMVFHFVAFIMLQTVVLTLLYVEAST